MAKRPLVLALAAALVALAADGFFETGWPRQPVAADLRGLTVVNELPG